MRAPHGDQIVEGYLARLKVALRDSNPASGAEIEGDLRAHIAEARASISNESDADVFNLLERLGEPETLAAEHREPRRFPPTETGGGGGGNDREERPQHTRCSFCGKWQDQVRKLVAGPGVYICDQCIDLCQEVLEEDTIDSANGG